MFVQPTIRQVIDQAAALGIDIDGDQAVIYHAAAVEQLRNLYDFLQERLAEEPPPLSFPERARGYRPSVDEDPYRAWLWKCQIGGSTSGLLAGKRVSFKDHVSVAGIPQSFASYPMDSFVPDVDATIVTRVLDAGGTVVGKNMMGGFMADYGAPANPHNTDHEPGGSSSGSAVALAAGEVDVSFGGDQGGSIRIPAAYCGVLGLKPTFGLVSHFGVGFGAEPTVDHVGPMARRVEDLAAALEVVAGHDGRDPRQGREVPEHLDVLSGLDRGVAGVRIGILDEGFDEPIDPGVRDGVLAAIDVLAAAGADVTRVSIPQHGGMSDAYAALTLEGAQAIADTSFYGSGSKTYYPPATIVAMNRLWRDHPDMFNSGIRLNRIVAALARKDYHGAVYAKAHNVRPAFVRAYDSALAEVDILAMPTVREVAPKRTAKPADPIAALKDELHRRNWIYRPYTRNTLPSNYTGHPALAIPCGRVGGLPISLQLVGRFFDDPLLLRVAYAYQQSVDWEQLVGVPPSRPHST